MKKTVAAIVIAAVMAISIWSQMPAKAETVQPSDIYSLPQVHLG